MNFNDYQEGKENKQGKVIDHIYFKVEGKYVIYSCVDEQRIFFDGIDEIKENISIISKELARIEIIIHNRDYKFVNTQLVYAISTAADGNFTEATEILNKLEVKIYTAKKNSSIMHYIAGCLSILLINLIIYILTEFSNLESIGNFILVLNMSFLGSLGGFLSIIRRIKKIEIDVDTGFWLNFFNGASRILISIICSIFIYYLVKSNIILGILNDIDNNDYALYVFAIISGFSENFVPNIFDKIETDALKTMASKDA